LTSRGCASWDGADLAILSAASKPEDASPESLEETWRTYYANIFNPARLNIRAMQKEMPVRYWRNLPEAQLIPGLVKEAPRRVGIALETAGKAPTVRGRTPSTTPTRATDERTLESVKEAAESCQDCPLWQTGTQTVFGAGDANAKVMFVGEQPGDEEDIRGEPFVGPAGRLLDRALVDADVDRSRVYVTNAVKHFKWEPRGKRRLHKTPAQREIDACHQWLERELAIIKPEVIVCLGATAANSVLGGKVKVLANRGKFLTGPGGLCVLITVHPSSVLRAPEEQRELAYQALVNDLKEINRAIE
jgi:uracil-DNA glycosylase